MKRLLLSIITIIYLSIEPINAGVLDSSKAYINQAIFWKGKHLEDIDFAHVYPKVIYQKSYFSFIIMSATIVGAGTFTYFTAGAGAPASAIGASSVATWVGGGGAGAYMSGLSTIGSWFGGNAILGASILNGISIGTVGGATSTFSSLSLLGKASVMASVTAMSLDGVIFFKNEETNNLEYKVKIRIPQNLGSKDTRVLVDRFYQINQDMSDAIEDNDFRKQKSLFILKEKYNKDAITLLKKHITKEDNQEDLLVLSVFAWNNSEYKLFETALSRIDKSNLDNISFLDYLNALNHLSKGDTERSLGYLNIAIAKNSYAIEPIILYINILGNKNFIKNESKIISLLKKAENNFDSDKYLTSYNLSGVFYRIATFYFNNKQYIKAEKYYKKTYNELGLLQKYFFGKQLKHIVQLGIANSIYSQNMRNSANEIYIEIINDIDKENKEEMKQIREQYLGSNK